MKMFTNYFWLNVSFILPLFGAVLEGYANLALIKQFRGFNAHSRKKKNPLNVMQPEANL